VIKMEFEPTAIVVVSMKQVPLLRRQLPSVVTPEVKVAVPVGTPFPPAAVTVAVRRTLAPVKVVPEFCDTAAPGTGNHIA
jgi:hypothetical protein